MTVGENCSKIFRLVDLASEKAGRNADSVKVLAVSKTKPSKMVIEAFEAGLRMFGENYLQDAREKLSELDSIRDKTRWHFIGKLQGNKVKQVVKLFDCIETVDRVKLISAIDRHAAEYGKVQSVFIQVNIGNDPAKSGVKIKDLGQILDECCNYDKISVDGLMTITPLCEGEEEVRSYFKAMYDLFLEIKARYNERLPIKELSMGMSNDFHVAIEEGATIVRIGSAIFGPRQ